jgi:hypothetical protein
VPSVIGLAAPTLQRDVQAALPADPGVLKASDRIAVVFEEEFFMTELAGEFEASAQGKLPL